MVSTEATTKTALSAFLKHLLCLGSLKICILLPPTIKVQNTELKKKKKKNLERNNLREREFVALKTSTP